MLAITIFEIGSLLSAIAPSSPVLIIGRAVAGLGCSGIASGAFVILSKTVPLSRRPLFMGIVGATLGVASICGPPVGGAFTNNLTWRWCFYSMSCRLTEPLQGRRTVWIANECHTVNLPLGGFTIIALGLFLKLPVGTIPQRTAGDILTALDLPGLLMLFPAVIALLLALTWGGLVYPWSNWRVILLLAVSGCAFTTFAILQILRPESTIPSRIIRNRSVACAAILAFCAGASTLTIVYFLPLYFQGIKQASPVQSGIDVLPLAIGSVVFMLFAGAMGKLSRQVLPLVSVWA